MENNETLSAEVRNELVASLYRKHVKQLVEMAKRSGCSKDYAEDVVQEVFQVAIEKAEDLKVSKNQMGWLVLTLRNVIGTNYRAMKYARRYIEENQILHPRAYEDHLEPNTLFTGLVSEEELSILIQFCLNGMPIKEIAKDLGIGVETCKKRIQRAKLHFIKAYKEQIDDI